MRFQDNEHRDFINACAYLLLLRGVFENTGFEERVLLIRVIIHPFTEVVANVKPSGREVNPEYLSICILALMLLLKQTSNHD